MLNGSIHYLLHIGKIKLQTLQVCFIRVAVGAVAVTGSKRSNE
jgi:hypothetical protein